MAPYQGIEWPCSDDGKSRLCLVPRQIVEHLRNAAALLTVSLALAVVPFVAVCVAQPIDEEAIRHAVNGELGYQQRQQGILADGFYSELVWGGSPEVVEVAAVWSDRLPESWDSSTTIRIVKPGMCGGELLTENDTVCVRAHSLNRDQTLYQLNAWFTHGDTVLWNVGQVVAHPEAGVKLGPDDIGVYGYTEDVDVVYIALEFGHDSCRGVPEEQPNEIVLLVKNKMEWFTCDITDLKSFETVSILRDTDMPEVDDTISVVVPARFGSAVEIEFAGKVPGRATRHYSHFEFRFPDERTKSD